MNIEAYFRSISLECETLKNRVRMFIDDEHWPTDGEWKESVLRSIIRRSAPESVTIGRGFVVTPQWQSTQIDVLVYDNTHPVFYRDGDLVFVSPESCKAIVEVKSAIRSSSQLREAADKLADNAARIREATQDEMFVGLFAYESNVKIDHRVLDRLQEAAAGDGQRVVNHLALGPSSFIKFWRQRPENDPAMCNQWHLYALSDMAAGYFVHNLIHSIRQDFMTGNEGGWFPHSGKEVHLVCQLGLSAAPE